MPLLKPKSERRRTPFRSYTVIECPYNGHQVSFCRGLCTPYEGYGHCGRLAPHAMIGRTQAAIASYKDRALKSWVEDHQ
jgi:hypothetical protein